MQNLPNVRKERMEILSHKAGSYLQSQGVKIFTRINLSLTAGEERRFCCGGREMDVGAAHPPLFFTSLIIFLPSSAESSGQRGRKVSQIHKHAKTKKRFHPSGSNSAKAELSQIDSLRYS